MKLIIEKPTIVESVYENTDSGKKLYLEGVLSTAENINRNKRLYKKPLLEREFNRYIETKVKTNEAAGELNHPASPVVNPDRICHRIVEINQEGNDFYGKSLVINTPEGNRIRAFVEADLKVGVSTRALGTITKNENYNLVNEDLQLICVDVVMNPSNQKSFVNGILEGIDFLVENGVITKKELSDKEENIELIKTELKEAASNELAEAKIKAFNKFLALIKRT